MPRRKPSTKTFTVEQVAKDSFNAIIFKLRESFTNPRDSPLPSTLSAWLVNHTPEGETRLHQNTEKQFKEEVQYRIRQYIRPKRSTQMYNKEIQAQATLYVPNIVSYIQSQRTQHAIQWSLSENGSKCVLNSMRKELVKQASNELTQWVNDRGFLGRGQHCLYWYESSKDPNDNIYSAWSMRIPTSQLRLGDAFHHNIHIPDILEYHANQKLRHAAERYGVLIVGQKNNKYLYAIVNSGHLHIFNNLIVREPTPVEVIVDEVRFV